MQAPTGPVMYQSPTPPDPAAEQQTWAMEVRGVRTAEIAAICSLLGLALILIAPLLVLLVLGLHIPFVGVSFGTAAFTIQALEEIVALIVAGAALLLISVIIYVVSFNTFRKVTTGFGAPLALGIIGVLGIFLIFLGGTLILVSILQAVGCAANGDATSCVSLSTIAAGVYSLLGGLFLAFLGWIGMLIGIYRIGSRYHSTVTRIGAILYIIPIVSIVAPILVFVGIHGIRKQLDSQSGR